jgi:hypothetical protein
MEKLSVAGKVTGLGLAHQLYNDSVADTVESVKEWGLVPGGTDDFEIRVFLHYSEDEGYIPMYGIWNTATGVREAEQRQYKAAKTWALVLTQVANDEEINLDQPEFPELDTTTH